MLGPRASFCNCSRCADGQVCCLGGPKGGQLASRVNGMGWHLLVCAVLSHVSGSVCSVCAVVSGPVCTAHTAVVQLGVFALCSVLRMQTIAAAPICR
eukprot:1160633-Pelagomonas_calceolata.AAC.6